MIGLPSPVAVDLVRTIDTEFQGKYDSEEAYQRVCEKLQKNEIIRRCRPDMILTMFPDCNDPKMSNNDPRKKFLEKDKVNELARYAFPQGYKPLHQVHRPRNVLLPMAFMPDDEIIYLQNFVFYESLEEQYAPAKQLYEHVLDELDEVGHTLPEVQPAKIDDKDL